MSRSEHVLDAAGPVDAAELADVAGPVDAAELAD
ncbi:MAG: hypothetical protein QOD04_2821, partial [Pseudonocardiales bacterium]|nr:hypothetical protein [Pseudonocardiales bacterium]